MGKEFRNTKHFHWQKYTRDVRQRTSENRACGHNTTRILVHYTCVHEFVWIEVFPEIACSLPSLCLQGDFLGWPDRGRDVIMRVLDGIAIRQPNNDLFLDQCQRRWPDVDSELGYMMWSWPDIDAIVFMECRQWHDQGVAWHPFT